jgi:TatD DNase family protein
VALNLVDTHTHIFLNDFDGDRQRVIARARDAGVQFMVLPNIDSTSVDALLGVANEFSGYCMPLMGLHPTSVKEDFENELALVENHFAQHKFWGVGEIGIDLYWDKTFLDQQKLAFRHQLKLAKNYGLPVVIHSRNSFDEILEIVDQEIDPTLKGVFHSFSGTLSNYHHIMEYQTFKIGIGGVVTYKNGGVDKVVEHMDLQSIVLETDSPYLSPVPMRGKRNESANLTFIALRVAQILQLEVEQVAEITTQNAVSLFSLDQK